LKHVCFVISFSALLLVLVVANADPRLLAEQPSARPGVPAKSFSAAQHAANSSMLPLDFSNSQVYNTGSFNNYGIAVADLNGDGHPDVVVTGVTEAGSFVGVMMGNGDGTFAAPTTYSTGGTIAYSVAIADVNGDGLPDLIVANLYASYTSLEGNVGVLLGNGDGTFQPVVTYDSGGTRAEWVAVADVNGDKHPDIIVTNGCAIECQSNGTGLVSVLLNNGTGAFLPAANYSTGDSTGQPESVAVGDFNGDGYPDIVVSNQCADNSCNTGSLSVLLNNGNGIFQAPVQYSSGGYFYGLAVAVADMNGDGKLDLIVGNWCFNSDVCLYNQTGGVSVLLGNGDGTFQPPVTFLAGATVAGSLAVGDVNGDGYPDVLVLDGYGAVDVLLGNGDGSLRAPVSFSTSANPVSVAIADVNGDGRPDLLSANDTVNFSVWLNALYEPTTTVVTSSANPGLINQQVTFSATITSNSPIPDGTVITFSDPSELGTAATKNGIASLTMDFAQAKKYFIQGSFSGDAFHRKSSAYLPGGELVTPYPTTTAFTSSLNPSIYGQKVTWTATVTTSGPTRPTGRVGFVWDGFSIGGATLNADGVATVTLSILNADSYPLTAVYRGDANNASSASAILNQQVTEATSAAMLRSSTNPSTQGQAVTFTATITSPTVTPKGPVTFTAGNTTLGTAQMIAGKASFTTSNLAVGSVEVTATYYGDSNIAESSASVTQKVQQ
jgi:hypothetical protein